MIIRGQSHVLANGGLEWLAWLTEFEPSSGPAPYAALAAVGSKLSIAWIRGPFFRPDGSASLVGADSLVVITKKKLSAMFALWSLCDEHRYDWLRTLADLLAQHYLKRETLQSSRRGTVRIPVATCQLLIMSPPLLSGRVSTVQTQGNIPPASERSSESRVVQAETGPEDYW